MSGMRDYDILGELGRGAMGVVYKAQDLKIGRPVAIKVIRVDAGTTPFESAKLRQRLVREASAAGRIYHPGIVTVHQLGEDGENVFVVMEFVDGSSLEHLLTNNSVLDRAWILDILHQIADALDYAHKSNVIHRDIKPANILVRGDGRVKITDFGIAKIASAATAITGTGTSLGSPSYMSPEQIQAAQIDGRSDQFALGIVAFQMLTGQMPFHGDTAHAVMYQIVSVDPLVGDVPLTPEVRAVLARALAKNPVDRFDDCASFIRELMMAAGSRLPPSSAQTSTAIMDAPAPVGSAASPKGKSNALPLIVGLLAVAILGGGVYWFSHRASSTPLVAQAAPQQPLIKAITDGTLDEVNKLISPATVNVANPDGMTPLLAAVQYGKMEAVKTLLAKGANVNGVNRDGMTPLMLASEGTAYLPDNLPLVEILVAANANIEAQDSRGRTALHRATSEGKTEVVRLLLDHDAFIDKKSSEGATALFYAVEFGKMPILQLLIERKAQIELPDASGTMPLMLASEGNAYLPNNGPMVEALLAAGAHADVVDARGRSALYRASAEGKEDAMELLLDHQANPNLRANDRSTPLLEAVTFAKLAAAELLIDNGADVNMGDANDTTSLMIASETSPYIKSPAEFIKLLLDNGAKKTATDSRGRTALKRATESKNDAAVALLK